LYTIYPRADDENCVAHSGKESILESRAASMDFFNTFNYLFFIYLLHMLA